KPIYKTLVEGCSNAIYIISNDFHVLTVVCIDIDMDIQFLLEVFEDVHFQYFFLFKQIEMGQFFYQFPMWPSLLIEAFQFVETRQTQDFANGNVHEILLFFFRKIPFTLSSFLNTDQEQYTIGVCWFFAYNLPQLVQQPMPFSLKVQILFIHCFS